MVTPSLTDFVLSARDWTMPPFYIGVDTLSSLFSQLWTQFWLLLNVLHIPLPIGIIGLWRWSVWLLRRLIGLWYRPQPPNNFRASTAVITPVYNEEPDLFRAALRSWAANRPDEIIAVVDYTDTDCMEQFRAFEAECIGLPISLQMLITQTPGKRPALADGILAAKSEIVFLVDSDTIWDTDVLPKALAPFTEAEVGGVTIRQRVLNPGSTAQRLFDVYLDIRYIDEIRFLTAFGDAVTCLSGRTAVYRRAVALTALEDLMEETFWGRPVISGDDKALTLAVQSRGWKVRYQGNTCVYTPGATEMKMFLKQRLRWARNSWRADLKALGSGWAWRKPLFAFHLCDRLLQPLTTLVAPLYLGFAIYHGYWEAILLLLSWWTLSRTIKIWPHLQRKWTNIRILPWYIFFNYWSAVMKIYAFFTMNQQGWITRWSRGGKADAWLKTARALPSYLATATTVSLVALFIQSLHEIPARADNILPDNIATNNTTGNNPIIVAPLNPVTTQRPERDLLLDFQTATDLTVAQTNGDRPPQSMAKTKESKEESKDPVALQPTLLQIAPRTNSERMRTTAALTGTSVTSATLTTTTRLVTDKQTMALTVAVTNTNATELCILDGTADGVCKSYRLVAPVAAGPHHERAQDAGGTEILTDKANTWWLTQVQERFAALTATVSTPPSPTDKSSRGTDLIRSDASLQTNLLCVTVRGEELCTQYAPAAE